jgi:hypothetical protein
MFRITYPFRYRFSLVLDDDVLMVAASYHHYSLDATLYHVSVYMLLVSSSD